MTFLMGPSVRRGSGFVQPAAADRVGWLTFPWIYPVFFPPCRVTPSGYRRETGCGQGAKAPPRAGFPSRVDCPSPVRACRGASWAEEAPRRSSWYHMEPRAVKSKFAKAFRDVRGLARRCRGRPDPRPPRSGKRVERERPMPRPSRRPGRHFFLDTPGG